MITVGCSVKLFVWDKTKAIPVYKFLPGTRESPHQLTYGSSMVDELSYKFETNPATNEHQFYRNIKESIKELEELLRKVNPDYSFINTPFCTFSTEDFDKLPDEAKNIDMIPEYSDSGSIQYPISIRDNPYRAGGSTISIGWTKEVSNENEAHFRVCSRVARNFTSHEFFRPKTLLERKRLLYNNANNAFRPKSYGLELRGPSARWIKTESSIKRMFFVIQNHSYAIGIR